MALITHDCGAYISSEADICPMCGKRVRANSETFDCKTCGATLFVEDHFVSYTDEYLQDGNTRHITRWTQDPCSRCGDPEPIVEVPAGTSGWFAFMMWLIFTIVLFFVIGITTHQVFFGIVGGPFLSLIITAVLFWRPNREKTAIKQKLRENRAAV